jgi:DNA-binding transcriptional ArsR family regulator
MALDESATLADGAPTATLDLEELERHPPRVAVTPGPSLFTLAADAVGARRGVPTEWIRAARAELEPTDLAALAPIGAQWGSFSPACVSTVGDQESPGGIAQELERIATLPVETLLADLAYACGSPPPRRWEAVARHPRRWLVGYARALGRVWKGIREPWMAAGGLFEREVERVEVAAERGALPELVAGLHHRAEVTDGAWCLATDEPQTLRVPEDGLMIIPVLAGPGSARARLDETGILEALSYPLPGATRVLDGELLAPARALEALLGDQRARILRVLDDPRPAGGVAEAITATPGAATHHLRALETAGLVVRERAGRKVFVHRTTRGSALLALYEDA